MLFDLIKIDGVSDDFLREVKEFIDQWNDDSDTITVQTSGSTGKPKEIHLEKMRMRASARATGRYFNFKPEQVALLNLSPKFIAGKMMIVRAIEHNMVLMLAPLQANPLLNIPNDVHIHFGAFVPSQMHAILKDQTSIDALEKISNVIIGGAPLDPQTENALSQLSNQMFASFGMTETITHFALRKLGTPIYKCLDGFRVSADDQSCLVIHENEVVKEKVFTNDVIRPIDGVTFRWSGRIDNVINSGGVKIYPEKAEKMIAHLIPNNRFYITAKDDEEFGEIAVLVVEGEINNDNLLEDAKESLPNYHAPKELILEESFEETPTQKVKRKRF